MNLEMQKEYLKKTRAYDLKVTNQKRKSMQAPKMKAKQKTKKI